MSVNVCVRSFDVTGAACKTIKIETLLITFGRGSCLHAQCTHLTSKRSHAGKAPCGDLHAFQVAKRLSGQSAEIRSAVHDAESVTC